MDAADDQDLVLQKQSPELISKLQRYLPRFLWESTIHDYGIALGSQTHVRLLVRQSKTDQLLKLVGPSEALL